MPLIRITELPYAYKQLGLYVGLRSELIVAIDCMFKLLLPPPPPESPDEPPPLLQADREKVKQTVNILLIWHDLTDFRLLNFIIRPR